VPIVEYVPHIELLLRALRINRDRLNSKSKIAIDAKLLRTLLETIAAAQDFSEEFYLGTYPDIAEAHAAGQITDLKRHFVELGFFEGRMGAPPPVDESYYLGLYKDIEAAVQHGDVKSGAEHYMRSGAAEGRIPSAELLDQVNAWMSVLRDDVNRG
jgi:hypothetical protein